MRMNADNPTVVDLYAGAGLLSHSFATEGFCIVQAVEWDKTAAATYALNVGPHVICDDVRRAAAIGRCDVLIGGPPCQGFSTLGKRKDDDPRNWLSLEMARWAKVLHPKVVVVENVEAFLHAAAWRKLSRAFELMGYSVSSHVLNAYDMGVPQLRSRSFTVASRIGSPSVTSVVRRPVRTVRNAWYGLSSVPDGRNHHYAPTPSSLALARMRAIPMGGDKRDVLRTAPHLAPPSWRQVSGQVTDVWGRLEWDRPSNTLRTALQNPSKGRYIHPEQDRVMSLREAARLHTIPDTWSFVGLPTQVARQIGNSVPPAMGRAIARAVRALL